MRHHRLPLKLVSWQALTSHEGWGWEPLVWHLKCAEPGPPCPLQPSNCRPDSDPHLLCCLSSFWALCRSGQVVLCWAMFNLGSGHSLLRNTRHWYSHVAPQEQAVLSTWTETENQPELGRGMSPALAPSLICPLAMVVCWGVKLESHRWQVLTTEPSPLHYSFCLVLLGGGGESK